MELDIIKLQTTWNDAAASINTNFSKIKRAVRDGIPVVDTPVDDIVSDTSENAIQNKVIKKYVDDLEANIKESPSEFVPLKTINGKSVYGEGNIVIEGGNGGTGLKYSEERTVYLTEIHEDGDYTLEITEEERAYNIETVNKVLEGFDAGNQKVFISLFGAFYFFQYGRISDDKKSATFNDVTEYEGVLHSMKVTITSEGDAIAEATQIKTGGSATPSDMNSDFSNDF